MTTLKNIGIFLLGVAVIAVTVMWVTQSRKARELDDVLRQQQAKLDSMRTLAEIRNDSLLVLRDSLEQKDIEIVEKWRTDSVYIVEKYKDTLEYYQNLQVEYFLSQTMDTSSNHLDSLVQIPYPNIVVANEIMTERHVYKSLYDSLSLAFNRRGDYINRMESINDSIYSNYQSITAQQDSVILQQRRVIVSNKQIIKHRTSILYGSIGLNLLLLIILL